jgi:hypothetical protein
MHQQVRTSTTRTGSGSPGPGAMAAEGGLVHILTTLLGAGVNLRTAGGRDLDKGGDFVFSVHHKEGDDRPDQAAAELLRSVGYNEADVYSVRECIVSDQPGSLLRCIEETERERGPVYEIFVGTHDDDGNIPIQIVTRQDIKPKSAS